MNLTIGSGPHYMPGWVNLDLNDDPTWSHSPDVLGSIYKLPFEDDTADKVYLGHILEHLEWDSLPAALKEVSRVCKPEGVIGVVGPCLDKAIRTEQPRNILEAILAGDAVTAGYAHQWTPTTLLTKLALETTLSNVQEVLITAFRKPEWPNPEPDSFWQCAFTAKP